MPDRTVQPDETWLNVILDGARELDRLQAERKARYAVHVAPIDEKIEAVKRRLAVFAAPVAPTQASQAGDEQDAPATAAARQSPPSNEPTDLVGRWIARWRKHRPRAEQVMRLILAKPDTGYEALVAVLYGETTKQNVFNARSLIHSMKGEGLIAGKPGAWRVLEPTEEVPTT